MFKRCKVVMLPTNEKASVIGLYKDTGKLVFNNSIKDIARGIPQHLYVVSDDKIEVGDWVYRRGAYNDGSAMIKQTEKGIDSQRMESLGYLKIIATTNRLLFLEREYESIHLGKGQISYIGLPKLSRSFIQKYVEEYNKGNIITDVMVEYEPDLSFTYTRDNKELYPILKVGKDYTITIKKVKDSWSRNEVVELCRDAFDNLGKYVSFNEWINKNLYEE